jgi:uracil-DNA glycosylase
MSLERQLQFDISRCSLCPLAADRTFFAPTISSHADTVILLEGPSSGVCEQQNPWKSSGASFLVRAIGHASGMDLSRFHLTYTAKCYQRLDGMVPPVRKRREWAQVCAMAYLTKELQEIRPRQILIFGELPVRVCFPNLTQSWEELVGSSHDLEPLGIKTTFFEQPSRLQKMGLDGAEGEVFLQKLHGLLGGTFSAPDLREETNLFDFF